MKIGIIKEGKIPIDRRVAFSPEACVHLQNTFSQLQFKIQPSPIRCFPDQAYQAAGLPISEDLSDCDVLFGIKEVPIIDLIPHKTYFFFSHTIKKQSYNRELLRRLLSNQVQMIDYECLTNLRGQRLVAFGRFAGIVGAYNTIRAYGLRQGLFDLKPAYQCDDMAMMQQEYQKLALGPIKIILTGRGRAGQGAREVLKAMGIVEVSAQEILEQSFVHPVFSQLKSRDYYQPKEAKEGAALDFYQEPEAFKSDFLKYAQVSDVFISAHYWNPKASALFQLSEIKRPDFRIKVIGDITCDVQGSIPSTLRVSTVKAPFYDYDPHKEKEARAFSDPGNITVMAVDNLPTELPRDASLDFGQQLGEVVIPRLLGVDEEAVLERATISQGGRLMPNYAYLRDFVESPA
ncbi:MAG: alanine dehydrogenase [Bacteroidota bacterium]